MPELTTDPMTIPASASHEAAWAKVLYEALLRTERSPIYESVVADLEHRPVLTVARSA